MSTPRPRLQHVPLPRLEPPLIPRRTLLNRKIRHESQTLDIETRFRKLIQKLATKQQIHLTEFTSSRQALKRGRHIQQHRQHSIGRDVAELETSDESCAAGAYAAHPASLALAAFGAPGEDERVCDGFVEEGFGFVADLRAGAEEGWFFESSGFVVEDTVIGLVLEGEFVDLKAELGGEFAEEKGVRVFSFFRFWYGCGGNW